MINKPFFAPPARRAAQVGQNLPPASPNFQNLPAGYDVQALVKALQACGVSCAPGGVNAADMPAVLAAQMQASQPQRCRRTLLGLTKFTVPANQFASGQTQPDQWAFRGLRLIVPTDISASGDLTQLDVGTETQIAKSQSAGQAGIPLRVFDQTSQDSGFIDMDWCPTTTTIKIGVQNKFAAQFDFEGALEGLQLLA